MNLHEAQHDLPLEALLQPTGTLLRLSDVQPEPVDWLYYPYIPKGKLTLLEGDPGVGKSWVSLAIATGVSLGCGLPGMDPVQPQTVLLLTAEDGLADTVRPRLEGMGADLDLIHAEQAPLILDDDGLRTLEADIAKLKPDLVTIDPLVAYFGPGVDLNKATDTRAVMARLADLAQRYGCAILAIRHLTKGGRLQPLYRGLGSIDLAAAARSVLLAGYDPEDPDTRALVHIKSNLAPTGRALGYEIQDGAFYWTGQSDLTAPEILAGTDPKAESRLQSAMEFLRGSLTNGPRPAPEILQEAKTLRIANRTLRRAKRELRVHSNPIKEPGKRGSGGWEWELPTYSEGQDGQVDDWQPGNEQDWEEGEIQ